MLSMEFQGGFRLIGEGIANDRGSKIMAQNGEVKRWGSTEEHKLLTLLNVGKRNSNGFGS